MGFLGLGDPYTWEDSREEAIQYVWEHGIQQFVHMWKKVKDINNDSLKWGDEIEYGIFTVDDSSGTIRCSMRGAEILSTLQRAEQPSPASNKSADSSHQSSGECNWVPEYGAWMGSSRPASNRRLIDDPPHAFSLTIRKLSNPNPAVEGTPAQPYTGFASDLLAVEKNMRKRRARLLAALKPDEICPTVPCFPLLGVGQWTEPAAAPGGPVAKSLFVPDECINPHPRFAALTQNIRRRKGSKVDIRMPRFVDTHTPAPALPKGCPAPESVAAADSMDEVYMDAMAFGMGCCCLQVTFQAREVAESRHLYDQLAVLSPMFLALTAATPYARGSLLDTDSRWDIISQSVDDRTPAERSAPSAAADASSSHYHPSMAAGGRTAQHKSRYDSISLYICEALGKDSTTCSALLNDVPAPHDECAYGQLVEAGIDPLLARHVAHLFSRDPLVIFRGRVSEIDDLESTEHFENLQSTNWQTVRWKPPPASSKRLGGDADIGWRVEFRSMEVQLTDFENAAFTVFIVLVSRVILYFDLNLYQPLSKVDENMKRAQTRDALLAQKFWFCQTLMPSDGCGCPGEYANSGPAPKAPPSAEDRKLPRDKVAGVVGELPMQEISVLEMLQGKGDFKGLVPMIMAYLDVIGTDAITLRGVSTYLDFIVARAAGELMTPAAWQRKYVRSHPDYKFDSKISSRIAADLMAKCHRIGKGLDKVPELHGAFHIEPVHAAATEALLVSNLPLQHSASSVGRAVERYAQRSELMAKKRKLQGELEQQKRQIQHTQQSLSAIESELEAYELPAMEGARLTPPVPASGV